MKAINGTKRLTQGAIFASLALAAHVIESWLPPLMVGVPMRIGLANVFVILALVGLGIREGVLVQCVRLVLGALFAGSPSGLIYSMPAGLASVAVMALMLGSMRRGRVSLIGISVLGAFVFNAVQLTVGAALLGGALMLYLPAAGLASIAAGAFVGALALWTVRGTGARDDGALPHAPLKG